MLLVGVGVNSSGDPDIGSSCWELVLQEEVRRLVEGEGSWFSGIGLEVGVRLQFVDFKLLVWSMQGITERMGLNNALDDLFECFPTDQDSTL